MPGVFRPYNLTDVLGTINDQALDAQQGNDPSTGVGYFAEADETATVADSATLTHAPATGWDAGTWGCTTWA